MINGFDEDKKDYSEIQQRIWTIVLSLVFIVIAIFSVKNESPWLIIVAFILSFLSWIIVTHSFVINSINKKQEPYIQKYMYLSRLYPEIESCFKLRDGVNCDIKDVKGRTKKLLDILEVFDKNPELIRELISVKLRNELLENSNSNLSAIPYMAQIVADYETYGLEIVAQQLDWGNNQKRAEKVKSIREIRKDAQAMVAKNKEAQYQLAYLLELFPTLQDVIECEFSQLPVIKVEELSEYDRTRDYLSKEEYEKLSTVEKNQLALDRYKESKNKTKWQIGRDYELYVGYKYMQKGYDVDCFGSYMGLEDLGRDLIAKKGDNVLIIQCKYWSSLKEIHEKHITQLFGTMASYCIENNISRDRVKGILVTNISLSRMAKKMANHLGIEYVENFKAGDYPCIKCNIGHDEYGKTKIYHLPFDQQYDSTKIDSPGEFYAMTVKEAEEAGFRRAFKHFG